MKIVLITGFVDSNFQYREELYFNKIKNIYETYLFSSYYSPPQKVNYKITKLLGENHFRFKKVFKYKDIIVLPVYRKLKKINPDIIHLFDAQQFVGLIPLFYSYFNNKSIIYEHELKEYPYSFFGKIRFFLFTKPITKLLCKQAKLIRVVTPAAKQILLEMFKEKKLKEIISNKISLSTLFYSDSINNNYNLFYGNKSIDRKLTLLLSGKIDNIKFDKLCFFFENIYFISPDILFKFIMDLNSRQSIILKKILKSKNVSYEFNGILSKDEYYKILVNSDGVLFVNPTISFFEAIGCNLPIFIENNEFTSHLDSKNIFKYNFTNLQIDFDNYINSCKSFYYSSDSKFSETNIITNLESQYNSIYENTCSKK